MCLKSFVRKANFLKISKLSQDIYVCVNYNMSSHINHHENYNKSMLKVLFSILID